MRCLFGEVKLGEVKFEKNGHQFQWRCEKELQDCSNLVASEVKTAVKFCSSCTRVTRLVFLMLVCLETFWML